MASFFSTLTSSPKFTKKLKSKTLLRNFVIPQKYYTVQKMKFFTKDFFSKCDQIRSFLRLWSHLLKKSLMENFHFLCNFMKLSSLSMPHENIRKPEVFYYVYVVSRKSRSAAKKNRIMKLYFEIDVIGQLYSQRIECYAFDIECYTFESQRMLRVVNTSSKAE